MDYILLERSQCQCTPAKLTKCKKVRTLTTQEKTRIESQTADCTEETSNQGLLGKYVIKRKSKYSFRQKLYFLDCTPEN